MREVFIVPGVAMILLGFILPLSQIAESTSDKALNFAGDMNDAMDCARLGKPISQCSPGITDTSFKGEANKTMELLENMSDKLKEHSRGSCASDWVCTEWTSCENGTQTRRCADKNECESSDPPALNRSCVSTKQQTTPTHNTHESDEREKSSQNASTAASPASSTQLQVQDATVPANILLPFTIALLGLAAIFALHYQRRRRSPQKSLLQYLD